MELPDQSFVFPAAGPAGATLLLQLYLAAGGSLTNEAGQPDLQFEPLLSALQLLNNGRSNRFILPNSSNLITLDEAWPLFQNGNVTFAQTNSGQYLKKQAENETLGAALMPGLAEPLTPLVNGWAWAISATDSAKRPLAAELLSYLVDNPNLGEWSQQSQLLPARQGALFFWPEEDPYVQFASDMLLAAEAHPFPPTHPLMLALNDAAFDVISLSKSPQVAAEEAIQSLE
jgi:ABC-type glycerol-3-phosphate transport system substrate-binding protein